MKMSGEEVTVVQEEPLSPAARLFHAPRCNCHIIVIMGCKTKINPSVIKGGLEHTLVKHPRFSSRLVMDEKDGGKMKWIPTMVNLENHVIVPNMDPSNMNSPDEYVEDYVSYITQTPMDLSRPLWELHLLNIKTSDAEAVGVLRIHHSIGDGTSLISLLLALTRKTSDPESLPSVPTMKRVGSNYSGGFWWFLVAIWSAIMLVWNTFVDLVGFVATIMFLKDTETPIKGGPGVELTTKRFVHRTFNLEDVKLVKNSMNLNLTINDVLLGVTQAGLSHYLNRRYGEDKQETQTTEKKKNNLPQKIRFRATVLVNLRPTAGIQALADMMADKKSKAKWGNVIGYIFLPLNIALQDDPLDYVRKAKAIIDRKKLSLGAKCTSSAALFALKSFGIKVAAAITHRFFSSATIAFSNMVGPLEEISFYGHPLAYIAPTVYGNPHALTVHFQSHANKITIVIAVDPNVIPDPHRLCDDIEEGLNLIKGAVLEKHTHDKDGA